eukprot:gene52735-70496_t
MSAIPLNAEVDSLKVAATHFPLDLIAASVAALAIVGLLVPTAEACTRVLWKTDGLGVFTGRTMDFPVSTEPVLTVLPRGIEHDGGVFA